MIFQTLDDKKECIGVYTNNCIYQDITNLNLSKTWSYSGYLKDLDIQYASLYANGKSMDELCPENLKDEWEQVNKKLKAYVTSFFEAKVSLKENCFFDLIPKKTLVDYCELKNSICNYVFSTYEKPKEYDFLKRFNQLLYDIRYRELNIDLNNIKNKLYKDNALSFYRKINNNSNYINYNLFGTLTGRLSVKKDSFPILTFPKNYREILLPKNDWFISFDMNAAELRTALALLGKEQPTGDFHQWSVKNIYNNNLNRTEAKETTTSWLYNSNSPLALKYDNELNKIFDKQSLKNKYWINGKVHTPYNRIIDSDEHHAISYLNQSTFIDLFHRQIIKVDDFLKNKKSFISFLIHDEFVIDITDDEKDLLVDIIKLLQDTEYGLFPVNIKAGKNFGSMKKLNLKA